MLLRAAPVVLLDDPKALNLLVDAGLLQYVYIMDDGLLQPQREVPEDLREHEGSLPLQAMRCKRSAGN